MATAKKKIDSMSTSEKVGIGAGITAAAVAAAGAYFLYGSKDAQKNRKKVAGWAEDAKKEVLKGIEKAKNMTEEDYKELIEKAARAQAEIKKISKADLANFQKEMKAGWKVIAKNVVSGAAAAKRVMPDNGKTPTKSAAKAGATARKATAKAAPKAAPAKKVADKIAKVAPPEKKSVSKKS
ncbi:hemolysin XhlA family protein [Patescibacteria group bacterium]|nr:hemolysin XhlA family protein [Patescibacteria group bacterium]